MFQDKKKLVAIKSIKDLLNQIDFKAEKVVMNKENLMSLLLDLKGESLTEEEINVVNELVI
jgi:hypothetical protein